jgi:hypothetical protein
VVVVVVVGVTVVVVVVGATVVVLGARVLFPGVLVVVVLLHPEKTATHTMARYFIIFKELGNTREIVIIVGKS